MHIFLIKLRVEYMKPLITKQMFILLIVLCFFAFNHSFAQFNDYTAKIGLQFNGLLPDTEFDNNGVF